MTNIKLYHYTDERGLRGIKNSGIIRKTNANSPHAWYGGGVYFTSIPPTVDKLEIAQKNYKNGGYAMKARGRVDFYVEVVFDVWSSHVRCVNRHREVYLYYGGEVDLSYFKHSFGTTNYGRASSMNRLSGLMEVGCELENFKVEYFKLLDNVSSNGATSNSRIAPSLRFVNNDDQNNKINEHKPKEIKESVNVHSPGWLFTGIKWIMEKLLDLLKSHPVALGIFLLLIMLLMLWG